jgi:hypothetical protein
MDVNSSDILLPFQFYYKLGVLPAVIVMLDRRLARLNQKAGRRTLSAGENRVKAQ